MQRYALLWSRFLNREFNHDEIALVLNEKNSQLVSVFLAHLRKYGWLITKLDPVDNRKRIYQLKSPEEAVRSMIVSEEVAENLET